MLYGGTCFVPPPPSWDKLVLKLTKPGPLGPGTPPNNLFIYFSGRGGSMPGPRPDTFGRHGPKPPTTGPPTHPTVPTQAIFTLTCAAAVSFLLRVTN